MRIWVISSSYPRMPRESINAGVVARDLALNVRESGHDVVVVTPQKPGGVSFDPGIEGLVVPWLRPSLQLADLSKNPLDLVRGASLMINARRSLLRAAKRARPDGIIALWGLPSGIFARWVSRATGTPYVVWLLGSDVWRADRLPGGRSSLTRVVSEASATYADGRELAEEASRLTDLPIGFLPSARRLPPPTSEADVHPVDVLFVGRYHTNKGPDLLISALSILRAQGVRVTAELHGSGDLESKLSEMLNDTDLSDSVRIMPPIDAQELANRLASSRFLVIPSRIESIPLVLGDAIQAQRPVVATRVGDMGTLVESLSMGLTVEPNDATALAEGIREALNEGFEVRDWSSAEAKLSPSAAASELLSALDL